MGFNAHREVSGFKFLWFRFLGSELVGAVLRFRLEDSGFVGL